MTTGERIRNRRKSIGMSADKLADMIGVSRSTVFRYENGYIEKVPIENLVPIAQALNTSLAYLMGWSEDPSAYTEEMPIPLAGDGLEEIDIQIAGIVPKLSPAKKQEALRYLQYLEAREDM